MQQVRQRTARLRVAHSAQHRSRRFAHVAAGILRRQHEGFSSLFVRDALKRFDRGATHLGVFVGEAVHQQFEGVRIPALGQVFDGFAAGGGILGFQS